jgi:hypothetical protein
MQFKAEIKNDRSLVQEIATSIHNMTQLKLSAIRVRFNTRWYLVYNKFVTYWAVMDLSLICI